MSHPFDEAIALSPQGPDRWSGHSHPGWANMVGPYGGITAAVALQAVMQDPRCLGEPLALTLNYAAALADGPFEVQAQPVRTNRSTQHWSLTLSQAGEGGETQVMGTATAITAVRRPTWQAQDLPMPEAPDPSGVPAKAFYDKVEWMRRYDMRPLCGLVPEVQDGSEHDSLVRMWLRDAAGRALDFPALAAMADVFYPRIWLRRARWVPAGTVSQTIYFHANGEQVAAAGSEHLLAQARAQDFRMGFFDQTGHLWSRSGLLLASAHQIVYYKE